MIILQLKYFKFNINFKFLNILKFKLFYKNILNFIIIFIFYNYQ